jgi:hypothetical protein
MPGRNNAEAGDAEPQTEEAQPADNADGGEERAAKSDDAQASGGGGEEKRASDDEPQAAEPASEEPKSEEPSSEEPKSEEPSNGDEPKSEEPSEEKTEVAAETDAEQSRGGASAIEDRAELGCGDVDLDAAGSEDVCDELAPHEIEMDVVRVTRSGGATPGRELEAVAATRAAALCPALASADNRRRLEAARSKPARSLTVEESLLVLSAIYFAEMIDLRWPSNFQSSGKTPEDRLASAAPRRQKDAAAWIDARGLKSGGPAARESTRIAMGPWIQVPPGLEGRSGSRLIGIYSASDKAYGEVQAVHPRAAVGLLRLLCWLKTQKASNALWHSGISGGGEGFHGTGQCIDIWGSKGPTAADTFMVLEDWGNTGSFPGSKSSKPPGGRVPYRLESMKPQPRATRFFADLYLFLRGEFNDTKSGAPTSIGEYSEILHPDWPEWRENGMGAKKHKNHIHVDVSDRVRP